MPTVAFSEIPTGAIFGDGKEGVYKKVPLFSVPPQGLRSCPEANALELVSPKLESGSPAWFAQDCDGLVYPLSGLLHLP